MHTTEANESYLNGVDLNVLGETIDAIKAQPSLGTFKFRNTNEWVDAGYSRSVIQSFFGCGQEDTTRIRPFHVDSDEAPILLSKDRAPNPPEYMLHALSACITTSIAYHAAARGIKIEKISSSSEGDLDLRGFLGLSSDVEKGFSKIRLQFNVDCNCDEETLRELMAFSPVYAMASKALPVEVKFNILS